MNEKIIITKRPYGIRRIISKMCVIMSRNALIPAALRIVILKAAGIKIGRGCFVGANVYFDEMRPDLIEIGEDTTITSGTRIISHFFKPGTPNYYYGKVKIGSKVFIGMNVLIVNAINIGDGAVVAAGSVVNKDISERELWGGNPAKFIRYLN